MGAHDPIAFSGAKQKWHRARKEMGSQDWASKAPYGYDRKIAALMV